MCGIIAVSGFRDVIQDLYDGLIVLQHRGQDAAGIVTYDNQFHLKKSVGMVSEVFHASSLARLKGPMGIGHVRYPTAGCSSEFEAQPFFVNSNASDMPAATFCKRRGRRTAIMPACCVTTVTWSLTG